jgi:Retrotransposon gag protein/Zinc knuckle
MSRTYQTRSQTRSAEPGSFRLPGLGTLEEVLRRHDLDPSERPPFQSFTADRDDLLSSTPRRLRHSMLERMLDDDAAAVERDVDPDSQANNPHPEASHNPPTRPDPPNPPVPSDGPPNGGGDGGDGGGGDDLSGEHEDPVGRVLVDLTAAIAALAQSAALARQPTEPTHRPKLHEPDQFDGTDPQKLRTFLVQCGLNFQERPKSFADERTKVLYATSFLKGTALSWFEPELLHPNPRRRPRWMDDYEYFVRELEENFGPHDLFGDAEHRLSTLSMSDNHRIAKYVVDFNRYASQLPGYGEIALRHHFYNGLPDRIKDEITRYGKPRSLHDMRALAQDIDGRYWERKGELTHRPRDRASSPDSKQNAKSGKKSKFPKPSNPPDSTSEPSTSADRSTKDPKRSKGKQPDSDLSSKLDKNGKLTKEERQRRFENNLCLFCGRSGHVAKDCPKSSSRVAKARAAQAEDVTDSGADSDEEKN